jgi:hypothetical protein
VARIAIELYLRSFNAAYRDDRFHAFRGNLASATPAEWDVRPLEWSTEVFGTQPDLSLCDIAHHVGGAMVMYTDRAFGESRLEWGDIHGPFGRDMEAVLGWLDRVQAEFAAGIAALSDDAELAEMRQAPWRAVLRRDQLIGLMINHQLYHSGEVNRQRSLIRGSTGWDRQ